MAVSRIEEVIEDIQAGKMVILVDDEDRENEGDLCMAAEAVTPEAINFMARYGRGLICLTLDRAQVKKLDLPMMVKKNKSPFETGFTVSIEARTGVTTGISAADRARTIQVAVNMAAKPEDIVSPGHIFPLRARRGGVLERTGQTEGSVDLARLAGMMPAGVICEIMKDDGTMARMPDLEAFAAEHGMKIATIADLVAYRLRRDTLVHRAVEARLPSHFGGEFKAIVYANDVDKHEHLALVKGEIDPDKEIMVRVHSECLTGDVFGSDRCDCGSQLQEAMRMVSAAGTGVILYMRQEGRGIGLINKLKAYALQDNEGLDTVDANLELGFKPDLRDYGIGAQILRDLGVRKMCLLTNNPKKIVGLEGYDLEVTRRLSIQIKPVPENISYLKCKKNKMGHLLDLPENTEI
ncbi:MAG: bifunctional 3,4-dihydroxy-2-butanone-4-phosphate synthase/GTP cyclohydrolase II [Desulfobulbaceae bacterium]|jgi:3,4-dihydroxy 2-butanone 4-phosphate synthase/GTP cyclohydrolase II|nr:bifunctional 3,4-dihydroxy-2-butanone-4-phosphate synthase/GTP cyclohydrolase II [Desulfobulbaceae bacterium]MDH3781149.1 bifunctional 3,4-dihydroxy-2-butanone-4-phosphate synthase/GTP cyclohydrolase II [Desulfobulbaceae bacterium]PLX47608.1 MAG: bifunctional 3,4-dihydroxy-2-butanone-4-phosphate synthase/GTP cyclohydrolase II [Desulfobulbaceae bacterium]HKJ15297.1 bifunctional 3,4-dihydroxy-2-butanone-4-phosphate synthase/GTP cyclohydrolase II [Desulfobulbales bacterium]